MEKIEEESHPKENKVQTIFKLSNGGSKTFVAVETLDENGMFINIEVLRLIDEPSSSKKFVNN